MELTDPQRRTLDELIGTGERPTFPNDLPRRLRERIEAEVLKLQLSETLWLGKEKLNDHDRCTGKYHANISGESPPFEHSAKTATGVLLHKAIEIEVGSRDLLDPLDIADVAAERVVERESRFAEYWRELDRMAQAEILAEVVRQVALFQGTFPPLRELRRELAPITEFGPKAELLDGALVLSGRIDLLLGLPDRREPTRAKRLAIDLKTGGAYPEYAEDMRFYALLLTFRFGVPPYRVASLFMDSGEWQAEDVSEELLEHAADRVVEAARSAAALFDGRDPELNPGRYCGWCPRSSVCPVAELVAV